MVSLCVLFFCVLMFWRLLVGVVLVVGFLFLIIILKIWGGGFLVEDFFEVDCVFSDIGLFCWCGVDKFLIDEYNVGLGILFRREFLLEDGFELIEVLVWFRLEVLFRSVFFLDFSLVLEVFVFRLLVLGLFLIRLMNCFVSLFVSIIFDIMLWMFLVGED